MSAPRRAALATIAALALLIACEPTSEPKGSPQLPPAQPAAAGANIDYKPVTATDELDGIDMVLEHSEGFLPLPGTTLTLRVRERKLSLSAGCKAMFGNYTVVSDGRLVTDTLGGTAEACRPALITQERWYRNFIASWPRIERSRSRLRLSSDEARLVFVERPRGAVVDGSPPTR